MQHLDDFADYRLVTGCIYCGALAQTREHVPSRVFLDAPFPENLPIVGACKTCNNGFSLDEEYLACLVESVVAGSTDPEMIRRPGVAKILRRSPALRARIEEAKSLVSGRVQFAIESKRVRNILLKLARGHAVFELSQACREEPAWVWWHPLELMEEDKRDDFESCHVVEGYGEIGSRNMQRMLVAQFTFQSEDGQTNNLSMVFNDWIEVQEGRYRYHAVDYGDLIKIKMVIGEYLACEVAWEA